jgi:hypothetical protein
MHPKILPQLGEAITEEAEALGLTQGQLIEKMWQVYLKALNGPENDRSGA